MPKFLFNLSPDQRVSLEEMAQASGVTVAWLLRQGADFCLGSGFLSGQGPGNDYFEDRASVWPTNR